MNKMIAATKMIIAKKSSMTAPAAIQLSRQCPSGAWDLQGRHQLKSPPAASPDAADRHAEAPRLGSNERQRQLFASAPVAVTATISTTTFATADSAPAATINAPR